MDETKNAMAVDMYFSSTHIVKNLLFARLLATAMSCLLPFDSYNHGRSEKIFY